MQAYFKYTCFDVMMIDLQIHFIDYLILIMHTAVILHAEFAHKVTRKMSVKKKGPYLIAQNFGGEMFWRIWQICERLPKIYPPKFTP